MRAFFVIFAVLCAALFPPFAHRCGAAEPSDAYKARLASVVKSLKLHSGGVYTLPYSHGKLNIASQYPTLDAPDALRFLEARNGESYTHANIDGLFIDVRAKAVIVYQFFDAGYVTLDDWKTVNADKLLTELKEEVHSHNDERVSNGAQPVEVLGWQSPPTLDRANHLVRWSTRLSAGNSSITNAVMLILGREGYEEVNWTGSVADNPEAMFKVARDAFLFPVGSAYSDHQNGDKVAAYGIGGLLAATLGIKLAAKLGLLALGLGFAKKFLALIVLAFAALRRIFKPATGRKPPPPAAP